MALMRTNHPVKLSDGRNRFSPGFSDESELDDFLSTPSPECIELMSRLDGDIVILGVGGKMGPTLGHMAVRAVEASGKSQTVYGVSRFGDPEVRRSLDEAGVKTIRCDLLDRDSYTNLPDAENVIYMAGRKFGTGGSEPLTWAMNACVPADVVRHYRHARIVVFSTGCVYPLTTASSGGSVEGDPPDPVGEYAQSCLARERIFQHYSAESGTRVLLFRLNYSVDLRYGVLHDIGTKVWNGDAVRPGAFNVIWQGDACGYALRCLEFCDSPAAVLNVTGPETADVGNTARTFGRIMGREPHIGEDPPETTYLSDAGRCFGLFDYPGVPLERMIEWQARWIMAGGRSLGKPTHFEVTDGKF